MVAARYLNNAKEETPIDLIIAGLQTHPTLTQMFGNTVINKPKTVKQFTRVFKSLNHFRTYTNPSNRLYSHNLHFNASSGATDHVKSLTTSPGIIVTNETSLRDLGTAIAAYRSTICARITSPSLYDATTQTPNSEILLTPNFERKNHRQTIFKPDRSFPITTSLPRSPIPVSPVPSLCSPSTPSFTATGRSS